MPWNKKKQIEEKLGQPLRAYLTTRFLEKAAQREVARELGLDRATIRYYIKKWDLPYDLKAATQKRKKTKLEREHLEVCICLLCRREFCQEVRKSHRRGHCVMQCRSFKGRHEAP